MAAISQVFTIRRVAQILGRHEDQLWDLSDQFEPEDAMLWVYDVDDAEILAFTHDGIEALREIIAAHRSRWGQGSQRRSGAPANGSGRTRYKYMRGTPTFI